MPIQFAGQMVKRVRRATAFRFRPELLEAMERIKRRSGGARKITAQIEDAIREYLAVRGIRIAEEGRSGLRRADTRRKPSARKQR